MPVKLLQLLSSVVVVNGLVHSLTPKLPQGVSDNLCIDGRLAPEVLLLGAARASTSLFAQNVHLSPGVFFPHCQEDEILEGRRTFCPEEGVKELHLFNHEERFALGQKDWLRHYPECQPTDDRRISTDLTPGYLKDSNVPGRIKQFYGDSISRVKFLAFLREPVKCMQSFFYYEHMDKKDKFQNWAQRILQAKGGQERHFQNAIYPEDLQRYFKTFNSSQFIIVPMKYNVVGGKDGEPEVTQFIWDKLGLPTGKKMEVETWNTHPHPQIEDDLDASTLASLHSLADSLSGSAKVARVLAAARNDGGGPLLYGFKGSPTDVSEIAAWLEDGW